jgi:SWI/SNF related-matrix-associated actin-dependent regulator of chromatin subfamily C
VDRIHALEVSVVKNTKRVKMDGDHDSIVVHWDNVATDVGDGVTASDCQRAFVNPPAENDKITTSSISTQSVFSKMLDEVHPDVLKAVVQASLQSTIDINEARKSSFVASVASAAVQKGMHAESEIENTLMEIVDQRLQRLENRVALLDDVEALLEAERVSLELERRDMYTARCRHWFGDGSS